MLYIKMNKDLPVEISESTPARLPNGSWDKSWKTRNDWTSYGQVCGLAKYLTAMTGRMFVGCDEGPGCSPQFDIIELPKVGDEVSYAFNGDYYPDGTITRITKTLQIKTSTGNRYYRRGVSGCWKMTGGTWSLVKGHINERNPSF
jgi:hypothetical protein